MRLEYRLAELREKAAPGPWHLRHAERGSCFIGAGDRIGTAEWQFVAEVHIKDSDGNGALVVAAINSLPAIEELLAAVREKIEYPELSDAELIKALTACDSIP